jgi:hypothetical protein
MSEVLTGTGGEEGDFELSDGHKTYIMLNYMKLSLKELTQAITGDPKATGLNKAGRAIKEFLASQSLKVKTTIYEKKPEIFLTEDQKEFIRANYDKMKQIELLRLAFKNEKLSPLHREYRLGIQFLQEIAPNFVKPEDKTTADEYDPVKSIYRLVPIVNKYVLNPKKEAHPLFEQNKLTAQDERNLRSLLTYLNVFRFKQQINKYTKQADRDLFESTFIRHTFDKTDLAQEEVDQYIALAANIVTSSQLDSEIEAYREIIDNQLSLNDSSKVSMSFVEALDNARDKKKEVQTTVDKLTKELNGSRANKLDNKINANSSILNLVEAFSHKKDRDEMVEMAERFKQDEEKQIDKLFAMDDMISILAGVTRDELLGKQ